MQSRCVLPAALAGAILLTGGARAQGTDERAGWSVQLGLYGWLPTFDARLNYALPPALGGTADVKAGSSNYLSELNAAVMVAGEARHDRFSIVTDFIYVGLGSDSSRVRPATSLRRTASRSWRRWARSESSWASVICAASCCTMPPSTSRRTW